LWAEASCSDELENCAGSVGANASSFKSRIGQTGKKAATFYQKLTIFLQILMPPQNITCTYIMKLDIYDHFLQLKSMQKYDNQIPA